MRFEGKTFVGEKITLDFNEFVACTFTKCEIVFNGYDTGLIGNSFDSCTFNLEGAAASTLAFMRGFWWTGPNGRQIVESWIGEMRNASPTE